VAAKSLTLHTEQPTGSRKAAFLLPKTIYKNGCLQNLTVSLWNCRYNGAG
jgi:hypothetical protein